MFEFLTAQLAELVKNHGTIGLFAAMVIGSSPIPVPVEVFALTAISLGAPPAQTALFAAVGATLGGALSYFVGSGSANFLNMEKKYASQLERARKWLDEKGALAVFIFALAPLPYDAMALAAGGAGMVKLHFLLATFVGRLLRYLFVVSIGSTALEFLYPYKVSYP